MAKEIFQRANLSLPSYFGGGTVLQVATRSVQAPNVNDRQEEKTIGQWVLSLCLNSVAGSLTSDKVRFRFQRTLTILTGLTQQGGIDASPGHEICTRWTAAGLRQQTASALGRHYAASNTAPVSSMSVEAEPMRTQSVGTMLSPPVPFQMMLRAQTSYLMRPLPHKRGGTIAKPRHTCQPAEVHKSRLQAGA